MHRTAVHSDGTARLLKFSSMAYFTWAFSKTCILSEEPKCSQVSPSKTRQIRQSKKSQLSHDQRRCRLQLVYPLMTSHEIQLVEQWQQLCRSQCGAGNKGKTIQISMHCQFSLHGTKAYTTSSMTEEFQAYHR